MRSVDAKFVRRRNAQAAGSGGVRSLRLTRDAFHELFGPGKVWSYPTFPLPLRVSCLIQTSKSDPVQSQQLWGASSSQSPQAPMRYSCVKDPSEAGISTQLGSLLMSLEDHVFSAK